MKTTVAGLIFVFSMSISSTAFSAEDAEPAPSEHEVTTEATEPTTVLPEFEDRRHFVGSSLFVLFNLIPWESPPQFYQLNYGYRLTPRDTMSIEAITWRYSAPLGIPYGASYGDPDEAYPGYVKGYGLGLAYQRYLWKGIYTAIHALPLLQNYIDPDGQIIQSGFQLFLTYRLGYHLSFFKDRVFIEPNIAFTHWPINTNMPESFAASESKWPNYFLFEPGFHFGVKF